MLCTLAHRRATGRKHWAEEGLVLSRETLEAVGSLVAISIERAGAVETLTRAEAARESEKLRSALLDSVTHEFRTPLTAIRTFGHHAAFAGPRQLGMLRGTCFTVINEETDRLNRPVGRSSRNGPARCSASGAAARASAWFANYQQRCGSRKV